MSVWFKLTSIRSRTNLEQPQNGSFLGVYINSIFSRSIPDIYFHMGTSPLRVHYGYHGINWILVRFLWDARSAISLLCPLGVTR